MRKPINFLWVVIILSFILISPALADEASTSTVEIQENSTSTLPTEIIIEEPATSTDFTSSTENEETSTTTISESHAELLNVHFTLRFQDQFIFQQSIDLPATTTIFFHGQNSTSTTSTIVDNQSVLTALLSADLLSDKFIISDLEFYSSFNSYLINCITLESTSSPACYNWQYVVDGAYPQIGMDSYSLTGGENVYVYFGTPWKISASTSTFSLGATTTFKSWRYNFDNLDDEWTTDANDVVDISIDNNVLTIKGESEKKSEVEDKNYYRKEIRRGSFYRSVPLPSQVIGDKASAEAINGILKIVVPKALGTKPKTIKIKTGKK